MNIVQACLCSSSPCQSTENDTLSRFSPPERLLLLSLLAWTWFSILTPLDHFRMEIPAFCRWIYSNAVNFIESVINISVVVVVVVVVNNGICHRNKENSQEKHCGCCWFQITDVFHQFLCFAFPIFQLFSFSGPFFRFSALAFSQSSPLACSTIFLKILNNLLHIGAVISFTILTHLLWYKIGMITFFKISKISKNWNLIYQFQLCQLW